MGRMGQSGQQANIITIKDASSPYGLTMLDSFPPKGEKSKFPPGIYAWRTPLSLYLREPFSSPPSSSRLQNWLFLSLFGPNACTPEPRSPETKILASIGVPSFSCSERYIQIKKYSLYITSRGRTLVSLTYYFTPRF